MIDIHSHILPGVDDGARNLDEALAMARLAVADGTTHLFATPHHIYFLPLTRKEVRGRVNALQKALDDAGIALTIVPGHEVRLYEDVLADWEVELAGPLGDSRYVLAEPDFYRFDRSNVRIVLEMIDRGIIPVLAHPERIIPIQEDLSLIEPILERGGLVQVTSDNLVPPVLAGSAGAKTHPLVSSKAARDTALEMLKRGWVHIIASDAHNTSSRRPGLSAARDAAAKIVGLPQAQAMVTTNPQAIVDDQPLLLRPDQAGMAPESPL
jgi:protein-tyrosine phosphatase